MKALFITILLSSTFAFAKSQTTIADLNEYPLSVRLQVQNVASAINLSSAKQIALANFYQAENIAIKDAQTNNLLPLQIEILQRELRAGFQAILSPQELSAYSVARKGAVYAEPHKDIESPKNPQ